MIRNLKMLGLALVAVCAMGAVAASGASATASYWFQSDGDWTVLSGSQGATHDVFTVHGGETTCNKATYTGSTNATTTTTLKLAPTYAECELKGVGKATIDVNGCEYEFHADSTATGATETTIVCPGTNEITVTAIVGGVLKCTIHIEQQNLGTGITLSNGTNDINAVVNFANIKYTQTAGTGAGACATTTTTTNGVYTGSATIQGKNTTNEATSISIS